MARRSYEPPAPKPYDFVSIPEVRSEDRKHPTGHHRYADGHISGHLEGALLALTPLHVGAGSLYLTDLDDPPLVKSHVRINERPAVPASTMKGMVRSIAEAMTRSCVRITRARRNQLPRGAAECRNEKQLCVACRMFGALGYQGLVRISDAVLRDEYQTQVARMPALYGPRQRAGIYRERGQVKGRKFYKHGQTVLDADTPVEVCPIQSELDFRIDFDNLTPAEVGVLLTAMGLGRPRFYLKVGGGKPACYGSVMVQIRSLQIWENASELYGQYDTEESDVEIGAYLRAARSLIEEDQLSQLVDVLGFDATRECPEGNY